MDRHATALEVAAAIRAKEVSPVEVLDGYLAEVDRLDPELHAFSLRDDERARADARAAAEAITGTPADELPPFLGVPLPIKDLNDVAGWPTTHGSEASSPDPAAADGLEIGRLRRAGFVFMGKTTTPELGAISCTESTRFGPTRNPWDPDRTPGGSSGGAAAAVASGMAPVAHASDGGGSIRIPASCTGLVGLKPSRNRVTSDVESLASASTSGALCTTVADSAALLDVLTELDTGAWNVAPPPARPFADEVGADPGRLRVLVAVDNALGIPPAPACVDATRSAADLLSDLGHDVREGSPHYPDPGAFLVGFLTVWATISAAQGLVDPDRMEAHNLASRAQAQATDSLTYVEALAQLQAASREFTSQFGRDFDVLVGPTMAIEPPPVGSVCAGIEDDPNAPVANSTPMAAYTALFNVSGQPAISLPLHVSVDGLPVGVQFAAPPWQEALLIRLASQIEAARPWAPLPDR